MNTFTQVIAIMTYWSRFQMMNVINYVPWKAPWVCTTFAWPSTTFASSAWNPRVMMEHWFGRSRITNEGNTMQLREGRCHCTVSRSIRQGRVVVWVLYTRRLVLWSILWNNGHFMVYIFRIWNSWVVGSRDLTESEKRVVIRLLVPRLYLNSFCDVVVTMKTLETWKNDQFHSWVRYILEMTQLITCTCV